MTAPTSTAPTKRLRLRYSLRTLLLLVLLCGGGMALWRAREPWQVLRTITEPAPIYHFALSPKGTYFATTFVLKKEEGAQLVVRVYDSDSDKLVREALQPAQSLSPTEWVGIGFSPGETYVTTGYWPSDYWQPRNPTFRNAFSIKTGEFVAPTLSADLKFSPNDRFMVDSYKLYRMPAKQLVELSEYPPSFPFRLSQLSQDESFLAVCDGDGDNIRIYSTASGMVLKRILASIDTRSSSRMQLSPDDRMLAISHLHRTMLYDISGKTGVAEFDGILPAFSADGRYLATYLRTKRQWVVWEHTTKREVVRFNLDSRNEGLAHVEFRGGCVCNYCPPEVYDLQTGKKLWSSTSTITYFDPSGQYALLRSEGRVTLVDAATGEVLQHFQHPANDITVPYCRMDGPSRRIYITFWGQPPELALDPRSHQLQIYHRVRPERWWGYAWLPEFWLTLVLAAALAWSIYKDRSQMGGRPVV